MQHAKALDLDLDWRIGEASFASIVRTLRDHPTRTILEFGSGASSVRLAIAFPDAEIIAVEHDSGFLAETQKLAKMYECHNLHLVLAPIRRHRWGGLTWIQSYAPFPPPAVVDCVIVDGPPHTYSRGREACLYWTYARLPIGGWIFLDDYQRAAERRILRNWLRRYPASFEVEERITGNGHELAVLQKIRHLSAPSGSSLDRVLAVISRRRSG